MKNKLKIGINGFGRIGRLIYRAALERDDVEIVAVNDPFVTVDYAQYLYTYDTIHGIAKYESKIEGNALITKNMKTEFTAFMDPAEIPWKKFGADYIMECTGKFTKNADCQKHIQSGAKKVIISAPSKDCPTYVVGVNSDKYNKKEDVINLASCTTNCLAPLVKVIDDVYGIEEGLMSTIHSVTATQLTVDGPSKKDWRGGRAASYNIIPSSTGAAKAVGQVLPHLEGKLTGMSFRVPTINVSAVDLTVRLKKATTYQDICKTVKKYADGAMKGILDTTDQLLVSSDFIGNPHTCIFDQNAGIMLNDKFVKLVAWYDNEYAYSCKMLDMAVIMHNKK